MRKLNTVLFLLVSLCSYSQTLLGVYTDLGKSMYRRKSGRDVPLPGNAWSAGLTAHFISSKRFNPIIDLGYTQKQYDAYTYIQRTIPYDFYITDTYTFKELHLNLGARFNILNKKHKLFIDISMNHNYILERSDKFMLNDETPSTSYYSVDNPYYSGVLCGMGYNYNNKFSVSFITKKAMSSFDNDGKTRLNMNCLTLCYFLPILANHRLKPLPLQTNEP